MKKIIIILLVALTACEKETDQELVVKGEHPIVGIWETISYEGFDTRGEGDECVAYFEVQDQSDVYETLEFTKSNIFILTDLYEGGTDRWTGTYEITGNKLRLFDDTETSNATFSISGSKMIISSIELSCGAPELINYTRK